MHNIHLALPKSPCSCSSQSARSILLIDSPNSNSGMHACMHYMDTNTTASCYGVSNFEISALKTWLRLLAWQFWFEPRPASQPARACHVCMCKYASIKISMPYTETIWLFWSKLKSPLALAKIKMDHKTDGVCVDRQKKDIYSDKEYVYWV